MGKLLGYFNMKNGKTGKVLFIASEIKTNGVGYAVDKKFVYDDVANAITQDSIGKEITFSKNVSIGE